MAGSNASSSKPKRTLMVRVALHLPADPQKLHVRCTAIWEAIKADSTTFQSPYPAAAEVEQDLAALADALKGAEGGGPIDTMAVRVAATKVRQTFGMLGKYVESVVRAGPIEDAPAIISKVLMFPSNVGKRAPKPVLEVRQGNASGLVALIARAVPLATVYYWEVSGDQQAWSAGPQSAQARGSIAGLTPGKTYYFRFRAFKRDGTMTDYSQVVSFMVK